METSPDKAGQAGGAMAGPPRGKDPPSDAEMVRRYQQGDVDAARTLFERYVPTLRARVRRKLPPAIRQKVAESDVIQDTFLDVLDHLGTFEDRGANAFRRWLATILEHRILDQVRRFDRSQKRDLRREQSLEGIAQPADGAPSPSRVAMAAEERAALWEALDHLSDDHARVIRLVHEEGLTLREAAEGMGRSAEAGRKLYGRALKKLEGLARGPGVAGSGVAVDGS
ncbi:MAG: sigma-70 family RNA polymerase sigma factor [Planctomycetota bacterium]